MSTASRGNRAESTYFAQPYNIDAIGFYFEDMEDYQAKAAHAVDAFGQPVEEFEFQYIDGDEAGLFNALRISQATLPEWFELVDQLDDDRYPVACHLAGQGYGVAEIIDRWDDYTLFRGTAADYAAEIVADCYALPSNLEAYIDYERLGRDMVLGGDIIELEHDLLLIGA